MAAASPTTSEPRAGWLDDHQLSAFSGCISDILDQISPRLKSDTDAATAIAAVTSAIRSACASFASQFNERNPRALTSRLPIDVLIAILYAADMPTRIRASHVSHDWRAIALAERGLWTVYRCRSSRNPERELMSSLSLLDAILRRSDPLPLLLELADDDPTPSDLVATITPHLHRLQVYEGSEYIFTLINAAGSPLCGLVSLDLVCGRWITGNRVPLSGVVLSRSLPSLRRLVAPLLDLQGQLFPTVRDLVYLADDVGSTDLFQCFPNLVRAEFHGRWDSRLPQGPIPRSIEDISVHVWPVGIPIEALRVWAAESIPTLVLLGVQSLDGVVSELLAAHTGPIAATIPVPTIKDLGRASDIILADAENLSRWCWVIRTEDLWNSPDCVSDIQHLFSAAQVVSLTISIDYLLTGFDGPHLLSLELRLTGRGGKELPSTWIGLRAPGLQHLVLDLGRTNVDASADDRTAEFVALQQNFRQLIVYDADLLETVTMRSSSCRPEGTDCAYFAQFAQRYIDIT